MLVLSRKSGQSLILTMADGTRAVLTVIDVRGDTIRLGIEAPMSVRADRVERTT